MGTKRQKRSRPIREDVPEGVLDYLVTGEMDCLDVFTMTDDEMRAVWNDHRVHLVAVYARKNPGRRPFGWWRYSSPEHRKRLGGKGMPCAECLAVVPSYTNGIPDYWISAFEAAFHRGEAVDCAGRLVAPADAGSGFAGVAIDPNDPPIFESQAAYLDRLGLLLPGERKRIIPEDWQPEVVETGDDKECEENK